jgi:mannose-1-phosphate guanylyltransferase/mannose-6-phosphate isomerase
LSNIIPVILSGGSGTRLWPLSRAQKPKQYLSLFGKNTMLQETILRLNGLEKIAKPIIICGADHRFLVAEQCKEIGLEDPTILLESAPRNTAPAIAVAAFQALKNYEDPILLVLSADHVIENIEVFQKTINIAIDNARRNKLTTFGILPTEANINYGYIKFNSKEISGAHKVEEFVEKPDPQTAKKYIESGDYLWNSGMFAFKSTVLINELKQYAPKILSSSKKAVQYSHIDLDFIRLEKRSFESSPSQSIDYALMEKSNNVVVVPLDAKWNDLGSWSALYDIGKKDKHRNVVIGDAYTLSTSNSFINANHHLVVTLGVDGLIIVDTPDTTFISTKERAHEVKLIVELLKSKNRDEYKEHRKVYRPWGWYDSIESGIHFQVKRLNVFPGAKLSLQKHHKRAEHWVVVMGTATAINGNDILTLSEGESTFIPIGVKHSLENQTNEKLEVIEVQSGTYLGEDDIIRFEDIYGRGKKDD